MNERSHLLWQPLCYSASIAAGYALIGAVYILFSDRVAVSMARSMEMLTVIQSVKGMAYVFGSALLLWVVSFVLFRRVYRSLLMSKQAKAALLDAQRRASAAAVALSLVHDVNNQLQVLHGITELLDGKRSLLGTDGEQWMDRLNTGIGKLRMLMKDMRTGGRRSLVTDLRTVELVPYIEESLRYLRAHERIKDCQLQLVAEASPLLVASPGLIHDALLNLVLNAGDAVHGRNASQEPGEIRIHVKSREERTVIEVHDNGPGVPLEMEATLFQPFCTSKPNGTGLGLVSVQACAELHKGEVHYERSPLGGACFRMTVASIDPPAAA